MILEYYTYTSGEVVNRAFNALATFFKTNTFGDYLQMCMMLGLITSLFIFMLSRNPKDLIKWMVVFFAVPLFLINMKADMLIIDKTQPGKAHKVDNVPYLVAVPTYFFSSIMVGMAEGVEAIFTTSDDERYGRTGMLFGSELYQLSRQSKVNELELQKLWRDYFNNCMIGDVRINHKYTWDDLFKAPDIFVFLDGIKQSPLRALYLDEGGGKSSYKLCEEAYPIIKQRFSDAADKNMSLLAHHLLGKEGDRYKPQVVQSLQRSYNKFFSISTSASNTIKQNMLMNEIRYNLDSLDPTQAALNYAYTTNKLQTTSMWASLGLMAREYLPMLHTMLFMLFACLGFFVAGAAVIPGLTLMVLKNYVGTFAFLATWPALFAIINGFQLWGLESLSTDVSGKFGGLVLSNANAADELHSRFAWMTGILMIGVPLIAGGILKGGQSVMSSMNYQLSSMINSTNARASAAASTGNLDFGSMQIDNHSMNNTHANKFDTNTLTNQGHSYTQNQDGSVTTQHGDGRTTYDSTQTTSRGNVSANTSSMLQESVANARSQTEQNLAQTSTQLGQTIQAGAALSDRWHDSVSKNLNYGEGSSTGFNTQVSQGMSNMQSAIENVIKQTGWTKDQSQAYLQSAYAGVDVGVGSGKSILPFSASANAGVKWSDEERTAYSNMSSEQKQQLEQATKQYTEGANAVTTASTQVDNKDTRTSVEQFAHDFAINASNTKSLGASVMQSQSDLNALSNTQTRLESGGASFTTNAIQGFQNYLERNIKDPEEVQRLMTAYQPEDIADAKKHWQEFTRTEAFATMAGLDGDSARVVAKMNQDYQTTTPTTPPQLTPEQSKTMENEWDKTQGAVDATRSAVMHNKGTGGLFNQDRFDGVTDNARQQQSDAQQSIAKPEPIIALTIKSQVEAEVTKPERTEYVTSDQSYPAAPRYTQNPNQ
ncbi:conjugal transfer mating pair stabilization protein TraG [Vibrio vulnificus]|uniref:conjugal transfer mating-pair stabilization protein TraG n=1 Tax=Vibrio vulnificus TaxID=672 RepID=UPI001A35688C|nr:conjugal transfer mating-pair stabilization protein TraG [Vibrio vulnificus]MCA4011181.1 conjugal transfer mating pair stabilization protein TraG [Vibrio vulnificus]HAS6352037.1 conjugal transfer mating pair stabilization protein TraG [Vibrio vulnificus]HAS6365938.1 conjugal transfer mating pair stabilization protein TraG [Vibrio vulnificus]HDY7612670.1 conjugal transfer mating pair stabilization protein TraG [Vibrio vulnificus]